MRNTDNKNVVYACNSCVYPFKDKEENVYNVIIVTKDII